MSTHPFLKHVYVLGAGFSRPLGGPLFDDLLTSAMRVRTVDFLKPDAEHQRLMKFFEQEWRSHVRDTRSEVELHLGKKMNVEEQLERLDYLSHRPASSIARELARSLCSTGHYTDDLEERRREIVRLLNACKRQIAAETDCFIHELPDKSDRWKPYETWFRRLSSNDTIITFNYDTLVETLSDRTNRGGFYKSIDPSPNDLIVDAYHPRQAPLLLKLHGSANWYQPTDSLIPQIRVKSFAYADSNANIAIGIPGTGKVDLANDNLRTVWELAKKSLEEANIVSVIGYSMPATDNIARNMIVEALAKGKRSVNQAALNIVLGPSSQSLEAMRLNAILSQAFCAERVFLRPMYAQDFIEQYIRTDFDSASSGSFNAS